jgi:hypothetical protein
MDFMPHSNIEATIESILANRPALQITGKGDLADYGIDPAMTPVLRDNVKPQHRTVETGSGLSTLLMILLGAQHTAISPDPGEPARIGKVCSEHKISVKGYHPIVGRSEDVLPSLPPGEQFDLALVDGNHAFPAACIDWFYLTRVLKTGGVMIIDDVQLWPCRIVADFLDGEDVWKRIVRTRRFAAYRLRVASPEALNRWWGAQPYVVDKSRRTFWRRILDRLHRS